MTYQTAPAVLSRKAAAAYIGICVTTLDRLADLPRVTVRGRIFYRPIDIEKWLERNAKPRSGKTIRA